MTSALLFEGKIALVTGSGRGIGRAIALHFARQGADLVVNYFRNRAPAEATAEEVRGLGRRCLLVRANVGEISDITHLFDQVENYYQGLDFLICSAASGYNRPAMEPVSERQLRSIRQVPFDSGSEVQIAPINLVAARAKFGISMIKDDAADGSAPGRRQARYAPCRSRLRRTAAG